MEGPNRLKHFMWRLAHNSLALRSNLSRRGMKIDPRCPLCNYAWEDGGHLFLRCKPVKAVWRCAGLEDLRVELTNCHDAKEVVSTILSKDNEVQLKASFLLNNVWHERNSVREGNQRRLSEVLAKLKWEASHGDHEPQFTGSCKLKRPWPIKDLGASFC
jgi:hypothetical protein